MALKQHKLHIQQLSCILVNFYQMWDGLQYVSPYHARRTSDRNIYHNVLSRLPPPTDSGMAADLSRFLKLLEGTIDLVKDDAIPWMAGGTSLDPDPHPESRYIISRAHILFSELLPWWASMVFLIFRLASASLLYPKPLLVAGSGHSNDG